MLLHLILAISKVRVVSIVKEAECRKQRQILKSQTNKQQTKLKHKQTHLGFLAYLYSDDVAFSQ